MPLTPEQIKYLDEQTGLQNNDDVRDNSFGQARAEQIRMLAKNRLQGEKADRPFLQKTADATKNFGVGTVKGAAATLATVPKNITKVVSRAVDVNEQDKLTEQLDKINSQNDLLVSKMKSARTPDEKAKWKKLIMQNQETAGMLRTTGMDISNEIGAFEQGFLDTANNMTRPEGTAQKLGFATEKIGEFFVPASFVKGATEKIASAHMPKLLESIARIGLNTAAPTVVSTAQQGEVNKEVGKTAAVAGAFSGLSEGMRVLSQTPAGQSFTKWLTEKLPGRKMNKILKPNNKEFDFNRNPGQTVAKEGITANSRGELLTKIGLKKQEVGSQIDDLLSDRTVAKEYVDRITKTQKNILSDVDFSGKSSDVMAQMKKDIIDNLSPKGIGADDFKIAQPVIDKIAKLDPNKFSSVDDFSAAVKKVIGGADKKVALDVSKTILTPIEEAKKQAVRSGDKAMFARLEDLQEGLTKEFDEAFKVVGDKPLSALTPKDVQQLKIGIGKDTRWTGQAFDQDINKVRVSIYRGLDKLLDNAAPGMDVLNNRYAGLLTAEKALERSNKNLQRLVEIGLRTTGVGGIISGASFARGESGPVALLKGALGAAAFQTLGSTPVQSRMANFYTKLTPENQRQFVELIKNVVLGAKTGSDGQEQDDESEE